MELKGEWSGVGRKARTDGDFRAGPGNADAFDTGVVHLIHRRFRVSNSIQTRRSDWAQPHKCRARSPSPKPPAPEDLDLLPLFGWGLLVV
jgi:hypothetical protein